MMDCISSILKICSLIIDVAAVITIFVKPVREKILGTSEAREGYKCLLRSEMLRIYYGGHDRGEKLRQHEMENFVLMYNAYKAMKGNSFIDGIYQKIIKMEVVT